MGAVFLESGVLGAQNAAQNVACASAEEISCGCATSA